MHVIARESGRSGNHLIRRGVLDAPLFAGHDKTVIQLITDKSLGGFAAKLTAAIMQGPITRIKEKSREARFPCQKPMPVARGAAGCWTGCGWRASAVARAGCWAGGGCRASRGAVAGGGDAAVPLLCGDDGRFATAGGFLLGGTQKSSGCC